MGCWREGKDPATPGLAGVGVLAHYQAFRQPDSWNVLALVFGVEPAEAFPMSAQLFDQQSRARPSAQDPAPLPSARAISWRRSSSRSLTRRQSNSVKRNPLPYVAPPSAAEPLKGRKESLAFVPGEHHRDAHHLARPREIAKVTEWTMEKASRKKDQGV